MTAGYCYYTLVPVPHRACVQQTTCMSQWQSQHTESRPSRSSASRAGPPAAAATGHGAGPQWQLDHMSRAVAGGPHESRSSCAPCLLQHIPLPPPAGVPPVPAVPHLALLRGHVSPPLCVIRAVPLGATPAQQTTGGTGGGGEGEEGQGSGGAGWRAAGGGGR